VCYGWLKEKAVIDLFISNFYADNAACVLRSDLIMYAVFAYLALFRLEEMGFQRFKEFTMTQDPTKIYNFASYLFDKVRSVSDSASFACSTLVLFLPLRLLLSLWSRQS
jgi:hypothetical protein